MADGIARPASSLLVPTISHGPRTSRQVALTFDEGPHPERTPQVADALATHSAAATFLAAEIDRGAAVVRALTGQEPVYRPPIGLKSPPLSRIAAQRQLSVIGWSLRSLDTRATDPEALAAKVLNRIQPGDIVLLHDDREVCARALPTLLEGLAHKQLQPVTVSTLLSGGPTPT
ncbi:MAG: peptidoglycan/xylan/chitin deacetylase (PgdA/CDA1 family) [Myxococcota bacterium]